MRGARRLRLKPAPARALLMRDARHEGRQAMGSSSEQYRVRELTGADAAACMAFVGAVERRDLQSRFAGATVRLDSLLPGERVDASRAALGAFDGRGALVGIVNLEPTEGGDTEIAILVRSDVQRSGA